LGDREGALHQFLAANAPAAAHNDLGATDLAEHRYKEARAEFQEALTIDPGYLLAAQNLKEVEVRLAPPPAYTIPAFAIPGPQAASGAGQSFSDALAENYLPRPPMPLSEHIRRAFLLQEDAAKSAQQARLDAVQPRLAGAWIEAQVPSPTVYAVQIFASRNPQAAQAGAESFAEKSGMTPSIERADLESKGTWFRARINGFESLSAALRAAKRLILAGLISEYWVTPVSE
jgi:hypothetical protein